MSDGDNSTAPVQTPKTEEPTQQALTEELHGLLHDDRLRECGAFVVHTDPGKLTVYLPTDTEEVVSVYIVMSVAGCKKIKGGCYVNGVKVPCPTV